LEAFAFAKTQIVAALAGVLIVQQYGILVIVIVLRKTLLLVYGEIVEQQGIKPLVVVLLS